MITSDAGAAAAAATAGIVLALPAFPSGKTAASPPDPCQRCSTPARNLSYLPSSFRIALLCPPCLASVSSSLSCLYCLLPFTSPTSIPTLPCRCCRRRVHASCIPAFHPSPPSHLFLCVDCCPYVRARTAAGPPKCQAGLRKACIVASGIACSLDENAVRGDGGVGIDCSRVLSVRNEAGVVGAPKCEAGLRKAGIACSLDENAGPKSEAVRGDGGGIGIACSGVLSIRREASVAGAPKCEAGLRKACIVDTHTGGSRSGVACSLDENVEPALGEARILAEPLRGDGGIGIACSRVLSIQNDPDKGARKCEAGLREAHVGEAARENGAVDMGIVGEETGATLSVSARGDVGSGSGEVGVDGASVSGRRNVELGAKENSQDSDGLRRVRRLGDSDRYQVKYSRKCEADIVGANVFQDSVRKNGGSCSRVPSRGNFFDGITEKKEMEQENGEACLGTACNVDIKSSGWDFPLDVSPRGDGGSCSGVEEMVIGGASRSPRRPIELSARGAGHDSNGSWQAQGLDDSVRYAVKYSRRR